MRFTAHHKRYLSALLPVAALGAALFAAGVLVAAGDESDGAPAPSPAANCSLFSGTERESLARWARRAAGFERSATTVEVSRKLGYSAYAAVLPAYDAASGTIDTHLFPAMEREGVKPAPPGTDYEFIRRATLDLTGRIPRPERVTRLAADATADKRAKLIDELLASPGWVDKWTMFYGDLLRNTARNDMVIRYAEGRNAFHQYIRQSLAANKFYDRMAAEIISAAGENSWEQGELNFVVGAVVTGGPVQDVYDQQTVHTFTAFLGVSHITCVLCHNGRGHLDSLSLWGRNAKRMEAWKLASHFSRTALTRVRTTANPNPYYWTVADNPRTIRTDYMLNTTSGNRPARCADGVKPDAGQPCPKTAAVAPEYWNGDQPRSGETYRQALARSITSDLQFARAAVNYVWAQFFGRGLVEPLDQFDPARLDPDNPPPAPWSLQPSNARLLNALAKDFVDSKFDLKALMRQIANSRAYQLSARYEGEWKPQYEPLFARKLVRRLWAEELHDAIAQATNILPSYNIAGIGRVRWAMQFPEPRQLPDGTGAVAQFLDAFLRGNREDQPRRDEGSLLQALNLMNDNFVMSRLNAVQNAGESGREFSLVWAASSKSDNELADLVFLSVLSRPPAGEERESALKEIRGTSGQERVRRTQNLIWALFNKVDFFFNY